MADEAFLGVIFGPLKQFFCADNALVTILPF